MPDFSQAKDLRAERADAAQQIAVLAKTIQDEDRGFTGEERSKFEELNEAVDTLKERIDLAEKAEQLQHEMKEPAGGFRSRDKYLLDDGRVVDRKPADRDKIVTREDCNNALRAWGMRADATPQMLDAAKKTQFDFSKNNLGCQLADTYTYRQMRDQFRRDGILYRATTAQSKGTNAAGGFTVPTELARTIEEALLWYGGMRDVATIIRTDGGHDLNLATADDTTAVASVLAENTAASVSNLIFAQNTMRAAKYSSGIVLASIELLQDTAIDLIDYVGRALGTRLARGTNRDYTTGSTATTSPRGIIRDTFQGYAATTGNLETSLVATVNMAHSVDIEYRNQGAGWMMHDGMVKEYRTLVDSNGQPLWQVSMRVGEPDMLLGYPVTKNNRLASSSTAAGATNVSLFGKLSAYHIRDVMNIDIIRFDERYMEKLQVGWLGVLRTDGKVLLASTRNASKPIAHLKATT
jgi:HK97 family phage major capsid protein